VALRTEQRDGHDFVAAAAKAGAAAAIVSRAVADVALPQLVVADPLAAFQAIARGHRRAFRGRVVGISGSAGKTSTKDLLALLLGGSTSGVVATEGNLNNHIGVPLTLTRIDPPQHRVAVVEAGISAPGEMAPLAAMIEPDVAIITLVAAAHTEALGGLEGVAREKAVLPAAVRTDGLALFPSSAAEYAPFRVMAGRVQVVEPVTAWDEAPARAGRLPFIITHRGEGTSVTLRMGEEVPETFHFRRVSDGMAQNAVLALAAALELGVKPAELRERLAGWRPGKLRGEMIEREGRLLYVDCYNANPASMADALTAFVALAPVGQPRLYVIGCMEELGPESPAYHRALGRSLNLGAHDRLLVIGTQAAAVCAGVAEGGGRGEAVESLEVVAPVVAQWRGAVFIKGSRRYRLETVLPAAA
jgi:UDP-N-acetylmuramoyl-tripeptide--D-alanyl-D-alanine ligase